MKASVNGVVYETESKLFGIVYNTLSRKVIRMLLPDSEEELCFNAGVVRLSQNESLLIASESSGADPGNVFDCQRLVDAL